jgi:hypothetical protein
VQYNNLQRDWRGAFVAFENAVVVLHAAAAAAGACTDSCRCTTCLEDNSGAGQKSLCLQTMRHQQRSLAAPLVTEICHWLQFNSTLLLLHRCKEQPA